MENKELKRLQRYLLHAKPANLYYKCSKTCIILFRAVNEDSLNLKALERILQRVKFAVHLPVETRTELSKVCSTFHLGSFPSTVVFGLKKALIRPRHL